MGEWSIQQAREAYNIGHWSGGYFDIGADGHLEARPQRNAAHGINLCRLTEEVQAEGLSLPVLVRFNGILHDRVAGLTAAFEGAMAEHDYRGGFTPVYPIKVNQQRSVVEEILVGGAGRVGLEAGSKPELMAVLALVPPGGVVVCNGYKDREYIRLALVGRALGHRVYIVVEKRSELELILDEAEALGIEPLLGIRLRLASIGAGKWQNSGGEKSKFGLSAADLLQVVERLRERGRSHCLELLHFHLGSQIANIRDIQRGIREAARFYAELRRMGLAVQVVDVGGGLGVDYEGTRSRSFCSMNYSVREYAHNVVHALWEVCTEQALPHPDIITESGRAMTAHHAVLITNVIDVERAPEAPPAEPPPADAPLLLHDLWHALTELDGGKSQRALLEIYHDAVYWLAEAQSMYTHGVLTLPQRAFAEQIYFAICHRVRGRLQPAVRAHREVLDELNEKLADKYFCNFSLFQSLPDVWGIDQIFPVVPLGRLDEPPTRRAVIEDITCDSDGRIDNYVDRDGVERTLPLHAPRPGAPYLLGFFMVGAYQEILGDMHNLFGDTDAVNVVMTGDGAYCLKNADRGDTVDDLLRYVHFAPENLIASYRRKVVAAGLPEGSAARYLEILQVGLQGYTYLEEE